jgi:hypothetical protein
MTMIARAMLEAAYLPAGLGLAALAGKSVDSVMEKDKLKIATGLLAINSFIFAWRAAKRKSII